MLKIHQSIHKKLDYFLEINKIPNLLFHGPNGSGKKTILTGFMEKIYPIPEERLQYVLEVNCGMGKGIKFIREELKFFAKTNIDHKASGRFKSIILYNVENLTIDGQSALRRCIEVYSFTTRFFMVTDDKYKLLKPILSRFCEIWVPLPIIRNKPTNLYQLQITTKITCLKTDWLYKQVKKNSNLNPVELIEFTKQLYQKGYSGVHILEYIRLYEPNTEEKYEWLIYLEKARKEIRNECLLMYMMLHMYYFREKYNVSEIQFI